MDSCATNVTIKIIMLRFTQADGKITLKGGHKPTIHVFTQIQTKLNYLG